MFSPSSEAVEYLRPGFYIDSDHPAVQAFSQAHSDPQLRPRENAVRLYYAVRDGFRYNPYHLDLRPEAMKASHLLGRDGGYCGEKACLLAAVARAAGIPARLGFAIVRNHIGTERLEDFLKTDKLVFHGFTELFLEGQWLKATPAFNKELCDKLGVAPLEFDGMQDSIFQEFDRKGGRFMEYLHDYGTFADLPRDMFLSEIRTHYPHFFEEGEAKRMGIFFVY
jgi:transglutaminase-like putative cysteine protease